MRICGCWCYWQVTIDTWRMTNFFFFFFPSICPFWHWCYYPHTPKYSVSPVRHFFLIFFFFDYLVVWLWADLYWSSMLSKIDKWYVCPPEPQSFAKCGPFWMTGRDLGTEARTPLQPGDGELKYGAGRAVNHWAVRCHPTAPHTSLVRELHWPGTGGFPL